MPSAGPRGGVPDISAMDAAALAERSLCRLGPAARNSCCVLVPPLPRTERLARVGFAHLTSSNEHNELPSLGGSDLDAYIIVTLESSLTACSNIVKQLVCCEDQVPIMVAILVPELEMVEGESAGDEGLWREFELSRRMTTHRSGLYEVGADEVICLVDGEPFSAYRLAEILHRTESMAMRTASAIEAEVAKVQAKATASIQSYHQRMMLHMPGHALEALPPEDPDLKEWRDGSKISGIGPCRFSSRLGKGSFGAVFKAQHKTHGTCAVKVVPKHRAIEETAGLLSLDREVALLLHLEPHPNLLRAYEVFHGRHCFAVVMEYAGEQNLQSFMKRSGTQQKSGSWKLSSDVADSFAKQMALAVDHLHAELVIHRDLKPSNWIVTDDGGTLKLADLGLAMQVVSGQQLLRQCCGSIPFCPPEVFSASELGAYDGFRADIWSLGLNYMELTEGLYAVDQQLGWVPRHPDSKDAICEGLASLPKLCQPGPDGDCKFAHVVAHMVVLDPSSRWSLTRVMGSEGLDMPVLLKPPKSRPRRFSVPSMSTLGQLPSMTGTMSNLPSTTEITEPRPLGKQRRHVAQPLTRTLLANIAGDDPPEKADGDVDSRHAFCEGAHSDGPSLNVRLGGFSALSSVCKEVYDEFVALHHFDQADGLAQDRLQKLEAVYTQHMPEIFDVLPSSEREAALFETIMKLHQDLPVLDRHVQALTYAFSRALGGLCPAEEDAMLAVDCFHRVIDELAAETSIRLVRAKLKNNSTWRNAIKLQLRDEQLDAFSSGLQSRTQSAPAFSAYHLHATDLKEHFIRYLSSGDDSPLSPAPILLQDGEANEGSPSPRGITKDPAHLAFIEAFREALEIAGLSEAAVEIFYLCLLQEFRH